MEPGSDTTERTEILTEAELTAEERKIVRNFSEKLDLTEPQEVARYGAAALNALSGFTEAVLSLTDTAVFGDISVLLSALAAQLKGFEEPDCTPGLPGVWNRLRGPVGVMKSRYHRLSVCVGGITENLRERRRRLTLAAESADRLCGRCEDFRKMLTMYLLSGRRGLERVRRSELAKLREAAERTELPTDVQEAKDLTEACDTFEKKLASIERLAACCTQAQPQLRSLLSAITGLAEALQTSAIDTAARWKRQIAAGFGAHSAEKLKEANAVFQNAVEATLRLHDTSAGQRDAAAAELSEIGGELRALLGGLRDAEN